MVFTQGAPNCLFSFTHHGGLVRGGYAPVSVSYHQKRVVRPGPVAEKHLSDVTLDRPEPFRQNALMATSFRSNSPLVATRGRRSLELP
jgi:hypothetical protein